MNYKKYIAASFSVFIIFGFIDFLFDFLILGPINRSLRNVWRPDMIHWLEPVTYLAASFLFMFLLTRTHAIKGLLQGIFYGTIVGLLVSGVCSFRQYANYPIPFILAVVWFAEGVIQYMIAGFVTALIFRPKTRPSA